MISCEKAAIICNKSQYQEASFTERLQLKFHLFICKNCCKYSEKNSKLTSLCDKAKLQGLSSKEKEQMKQKLHSKG